MVSFNTFDRVLKVMARNYAGQFLRLVFPNVTVKLLGTLENVEITLPEERVDFVHRLLCTGQEYLFHLEFQLQHRDDIPRRQFLYSAALTRQFDLPVVTAVLYLKRRIAPIPNEYVVQLGGKVANCFTYPVLKLWDYEEEIRSGQLRALVPLLVTLVDEPDESVLATERSLILRETNDKKRADLLASAVTVASRYFEKDFLWEFFREEVEQMRGATFIDDWLEEELRKGFQQGVQEGMQQGLRRGTVGAIRESVLNVLAARFDLPYAAGREIEERLAVIEDEAMLRELVTVAARAEDVTQFRARLEEILTSKGKTLPVTA